MSCAAWGTHKNSSTSFLVRRMYVKGPDRHERGSAHSEGLGGWTSNKGEYASYGTLILGRHNQLRCVRLGA